MGGKQNLQVNHIFGTCVNIERLARELRDIAQNLELSARNGVAKAHRLGAGQGKTLSALTQALAEIAPQVKAILRELESSSAHLAQVAAQGSQTGHVFMQYYRCLDHVLGHDAGSAQSFSVRLREFEGRADSEHGDNFAYRRNLLRMIEKMNVCLERLRDVFASSGRTTADIGMHLDVLQGHSRITEYQAKFLNIEGARLTENPEAFTDLATAVRQIVQEMNRYIRFLRQSLGNARELLETLAVQIQAA